ncbi:MAG: SDR family oxidoreductase [Nostocaceae cyanobacterium]|nr:SDR family oxidoreductase [Nostocaceae cyanobacterium]
MGHEKFLQGRVAMVTGGTSGIGRAIAQSLAARGANLAIGSRSASQSSCQAEIESLGVKALVMNLDVAATDSVKNFYESVVTTFGQVDILVNAAGITSVHSICGHPDELWHRIIDVNLNGIYRTIKLCLPGMIERQWGRIINIASTAATVGSPSVPAYCTSKAAVVGLTRCVALEGAPHGVTCNSISPGWVETELGKNAMQDFAALENQTLAEYFEAVKQSNPQKRIIQPPEIAALAAFLCRDEALGITMQDLTVSAGSLW